MSETSLKERNAIRLSFYSNFTVKPQLFNFYSNMTRTLLLLNYYNFYQRKIYENMILANKYDVTDTLSS